MDALFDMSDTELPVLSKSGFAKKIGVVPGRVTQMIGQGLPVEPNGQINVEAGIAWYRRNINSNRRNSFGDLDNGTRSAKADRDQAEARIAQLKAEKLAGNLIDRRRTLATIEGRARMERDAWLGWSRRVAPEIAAAFNADLAEVAALLDRLVRDQVASLADTPILGEPDDA